MSLFEIGVILALVGLVIWVWSMDRVVDAMAQVMVDDWKKEKTDAK